MKAKMVPALRDKRGLRRASAAEPQVVGLTPQTTKKRKTDTMKTCILRPEKTVEPQTAARPRRAVPPPAEPAPEIADAILADHAPVPPATASVLCLGLDVQPDGIVLIQPGESGLESWPSSGQG